MVEENDVEEEKEEDTKKQNKEEKEEENKKQNKKEENLIQEIQSMQDVNLTQKLNLEQEVKIFYTNYRGETVVRRIIPEQVKYLSNEWHKEKQWCLIAYDLDKNSYRTFACKDIKAWYLR